MNTEEYKDQGFRVVLGIIGGFEAKYPTDKYLCSWYTLEMYGSMHRLWPGFEQGPPRAFVKQAIEVGWVISTELPSPGRDFMSENYTLTDAGRAELARLKALMENTKPGGEG